ncbi:MAG: hypothetical protein M1814_006582 [Vezdaea aestivalis]|nr:MAG: hypothetical protein M1814_006582 [Vezdaea aestivalis]
MAPTRLKKNSPTRIGSAAQLSLPPMRKVATKPGAAHTPTRSPIKKKTRPISLAQKQALIDNLQLEITERARKMRAQYADQALALRTRLEMRISRVPKVLRDVKMGELVQKHTAQSNRPFGKAVDAPKARPETTTATEPFQSLPSLTSGSQRGIKRTSEASFSPDEKENGPRNGLSNPKKRVKVTATKTDISSPQAKLPSAQILSPKSSNSRTLPASPFKAALSPGKSIPVRATSPLKPVVGAGSTFTNLVAKAKSKRTVASKKIATVATATGVGRARRGVVAAQTAAKEAGGPKDRDAINTSTGSTKRTVVESKVKKVPVTKKSVAGTTAATRKKTVAATEAPARTIGGRTLRKRN